MLGKGTRRLLSLILGIVFGLEVQSVSVKSLSIQTSGNYISEAPLPTDLWLDFTKSVHYQKTGSRRQGESGHPLESHHTPPLLGKSSLHLWPWLPLLVQSTSPCAVLAVFPAPIWQPWPWVLVIPPPPCIPSAFRLPAVANLWVASWSPL